MWIATYSHLRPSATQPNRTNANPCSVLLCCSEHFRRVCVYLVCTPNFFSSLYATFVKFQTAFRYCQMVCNISNVKGARYDKIWDCNEPIRLKVVTCCYYLFFLSNSFEYFSRKLMIIKWKISANIKPIKL